MQVEIISLRKKVQIIERKEVLQRTEKSNIFLFRLLFQQQRNRFWNKKVKHLYTRYLRSWLPFINALAIIVINLLLLEFQLYHHIVLILRESKNNKGNKNANPNANADAHKYANSNIMTIQKKDNSNKMTILTKCWR